jgi:excinuclease ABC subunit B
MCVRSTKNQIENLVEEIKLVTHKGQRALVTTLTKRIAEELDSYLKELGMKSAYLHADVDTLERLEILRDLRMGVYDVLVGINLLREGLDLPEVSLVAILDADKEGFLRSEQALIQTMGRAARHSEGRVLLYADTITGSMKRAMNETDRRRKAQKEYNTKHGITPRGIQKNIGDSRLAGARAEENAESAASIKELKRMPKEERAQMLKQLEDQMYVAAENMEFEKAAKLRDMINAMKKR